MKKAKLFKSGDRVMYSAAFLKATFQHVGDIPFRVGTVAEVFEHISPTAGQYLTVLWDGKDEPKGVLACNLVLKSEIAKETT